ALLPISTLLSSIVSFTHLPLPFLFFFLMLPPPPSSTLFPYTTLFRSVLLVVTGMPSLLFLWLLATRREAALALEKEAVERQRNRSEEHTSELQSLRHLVCRLLLEKKKKKKKNT